MKLNEFFWHNGYCVIRNFISESEYLSILPEDLYAERHIEYLYDGTLEGDYKEEAHIDTNELLKEFEKEANK